MRVTESQKKATAARAARFYRHAAGRLTKREAERLGRLYGRDLHWKYLGVSGDKLALRGPGEFAARWRENKRFKNYDWRADSARHLAYYFAWYGPTSGYWSGDRWEFTPAVDGAGGGWHVVSANV